MELLKAITGNRELKHPKIGISTTKPKYHQSGEIAGQVRVSALDNSVTGAAIVLELREYWTETRMKEEYNHRSDTFRKTGVVVTESAALSSIALSGPFSFEPGSVHTFPFKVKLPRNCRLTMRNSGMRLTVALEGAGEIPVTSRKLNVLPAREFLAIIQSLEENMGFKENKRRRIWGPKFLWSAKTSSTYFRLTPPLPLNLRVKHVGLDLVQSEGFGVRGNLLIKPRRKSVYDFVKGALSLDLSRKPFFLNPSQVLKADGQPNRKAIIETIGSLIW